jgi:xylulokinase
MPVVWGVDSSTQSTKVEARDADSGALVALGHAPHPSTLPPRSEQDPSDWWRAFDQASAELPSADAIAVAAQQHGMVALDERRAVIRPAKLWNDTESAPDAAWLRKQLDDDGWVRACGSVPVAAFTISKLSWLHRSEPDAWNRLAHVCLPHDWLTLQLTGELITDRGDASGTGYFTAARNEYDYDVLRIVDDRDWKTALPRVLEPLEAAGEYKGAVIGPGTGDNMGAALALGLQPGDVAVSLGTSGTVYAVSATPTADASGAVAGFADARGQYLPLVCTLNATKVTDAVARLLGCDHHGLDELALASNPGAGETVVIPYFDGERTPNRPDATGSFLGMRSDVSREQFARAAVEGVVCGLLDGLDALHAAGVDTSGRMFLTGGGARSRAYRQVLADLAGRPVLVPHEAEHVAAGACVQAAAVLHQRWPEWDLGGIDTIEPSDIDRDAIRARYAAARG